MENAEGLGTSQGITELAELCRRSISFVIADQPQVPQAERNQLAERLSTKAAQLDRVARGLGILESVEGA